MQRVIGAAPEGAQDPASAARAVQKMFSAIAPRYDLLNHILSFNIDRLLWRRAAQTFASILGRRQRVVWLSAAEPATWRSRCGGKLERRVRRSWERISLIPCWCAQCENQ